MKKIALNGKSGKDLFALVDDEDFERVSKCKWYFLPTGHKTGYAKNRENIWLHRLIMNTPKGMDTDHINHNKLDNRKKNLKIVTRQQNQQNRLFYNYKRNEYLGVSWDKIANKWRGRIEITINGKRKQFSFHSKNKLEVKNWYNSKAKEIRII